MRQKMTNEDALPHDGDVEQLIADLENPDKNVRKTAIEALGEIGDERAIQPLIACLNDEDFLTKWAAEKAVGTFGALAFDPLMAAFKGPDGEMRTGAAGALGSLGDERAVEPLNLFRSNLKDANLTGADVTMADLGEATLPDGTEYRRGMDLSRFGTVGNPQTSL